MAALALLMIGFLPQTAQAQTTVCPGDEVCITLPSTVRGAIQWESSTDMVTWNDVSGATNDTLCETPAVETWYRAEISEGTCDPLYSDTIHVNFHAPVVVQCNPDIFLCEGESDTLGATIISGTPSYTYTWTPTNSISASNVLNPVAFPNATTTYTLTVTDTNGCAGSDSMTVNVWVRPTADAGVDTTIGCGVPHMLGGNPTASGGAGGYTYNWSGNVSSSSAANPTTTPNLLVTTYTVMVTDSNGCAAEDSVTITLNGLATPGSQTFAYTGAIQMFVVPPCVDTLTLEAWGGQGGIGPSNAGGLGGYAKGDLAVTPGETLYVYVGGVGQAHNFNGSVDYEALGGWNGGGKGGYDNSGQVQNGGGGGGASDIRRSMDTTYTGRVIVGAGGGGGAGGSFTPAAGGNGGGTTGVDGGFTYTASGGGGGTQSAGGVVSNTSRGATNGTLGRGGNGSTNQNAWGSGGGGAGYYGGAGGTSNNDHGSGHAGAGGGGSSYTGGLSNTTNTAGVRTGNGQIVITW